MKSVLHFVWRQYRFELASLSIVVLALSAIAAGLALLLISQQPSLDDLASCTENDSGLDLPACSNVASWLGLRETELGRLIGAVPFAVGGILGSVLVSREIEHKTAQFGWSLRGSRRRWLIERLLPVLAVMLVLLSTLGISAELLESARHPDLDILASLVGYGDRGVPIVVRGVAMFGLALLAGSIIGRQLPSLIVSGVLAVAIAYALVWLFPFGTSSRWLSDDVAIGPAITEADRLRASGFQTDEGAILTYRDALDLAPSNLVDSGDRDDWVWATLTPVSDVLEGSKLGEIQARETLGLVLVAVLAATASLGIVDRRRPF